MLFETFHWLITVTEVTGVIVAILVIGALSAVIPLWFLGKLVSPPPGIDQDPDDTD